MSEKVYCKNCKYRGNIMLGKDWNWCEKPSKAGFNEFTGMKISNATVYEKVELNNTGECEHYEPSIFKKIIDYLKK